MPTSEFPRMADTLFSLSVFVTKAMLTDSVLSRNIKAPKAQARHEKVLSLKPVKPSFKTKRYRVLDCSYDIRKEKGTDIS